MFFPNTSSGKETDILVGPNYLRGSHKLLDDWLCQKFFYVFRIKSEVHSGPEVTEPHIFGKGSHIEKIPRKKLKMTQKQSFRIFKENFVIRFVWKWSKMKALMAL